MLNKFKIVSLSVVAVLMIAGCNHDSNSDKSSGENQEQNSLPKFQIL